MLKSNRWWNFLRCGSTTYELDKCKDLFITVEEILLVNYVAASLVSLPVIFKCLRYEANNHIKTNIPNHN